MMTYFYSGYSPGYVTIKKVMTFYVRVSLLYVEGMLVRRQHAGRALQRTLDLSGEESHTGSDDGGFLIKGDLEIDCIKLKHFHF